MGIRIGDMIGIGKHGGVRLAGGGALPFSDTFTRSDGVLGAPWLGGSTWQIVSGKAVNTPGPLGAELLTDGGIEQWVNATGLTIWTKELGGTSTVNREGTVVHGGTYASRHDIDASDSEALIYQTITAAVGTWLSIAWFARASVAGKTAQIKSTAAGGSGPARTLTDTAWTGFRDTRRVTTANPAVGLADVTAASASVYFDDVSVKPLTLSSLFQAINAGTPNVDVSAAATIVAGTQAGVVVNLDSLSSPANFVIGYHDGVTAKLEKCVAGTYTTLISATTAYSAGAAVRVVKDGETVQLFYGASQVGTDQTVSDLTVINNAYHGVFSTYEGNSLDTFTVTAV